MDPRRGARVVIDPKVRQVGFFAPGASPGRTQSGPPESSSPPVADNSPTGNSLFPVMIPPPRHASDNLLSARPALYPPLRRPGDTIPVGSYNPSEFFHGTSPTASFYSKVGDGEFSEDASGAGWTHRGNSGKVASSFPGGGFDLTAVKPSNLTTVSVVNMPPGISVKSGGASIEVQNEQPASSRSLKEKTSKAERRALQEAQRAAKAAAKGGDGSSLF